MENEDLDTGIASGLSGLARASNFAYIARATSLGLALPIWLDGWSSRTGQDASTRCLCPSLRTPERVCLPRPLKDTSLSGFN